VLRQDNVARYSANVYLHCDASTPMTAISLEHVTAANQGHFTLNSKYVC
jgi:hypothetical protein